MIPYPENARRCGRSVRQHIALSSESKIEVSESCRPPVSQHLQSADSTYVTSNVFSEMAHTYILYGYHFTTFI